MEGRNNVCLHLSAPHCVRIGAQVGFFQQKSYGLKAYGTEIFRFGAEKIEESDENDTVPVIYKNIKDHMEIPERFHQSLFEN